MEETIKSNYLNDGESGACDGYVALVKEWRRLATEHTRDYGAAYIATTLNQCADELENQIRSTR